MNDHRQTPFKQGRCTGRGALLLAAVCLSLAGCAGYRVTGDDPRTGPFTQSETAATTTLVNGVRRLVVTYNDGTDPKGLVTYTQTSRNVRAGASMQGWSYSDDSGKTWTYGGSLSPPPGWAVLWGDPAATASRAHYSVAFISNLAVPNSKMPDGGINGSVIVFGADSHIGGACIARSIDGGTSFAHHQCVSNTEKNSTPRSELGHFYDGGSMAAGNDGAIYAAYVDVTTSAVDVWRAPNDAAQFARLPNPFPNIAIASHPRLRSSPFDNSVYVAAQATNGDVYINRLADGRWGNPVFVIGAELYPCIPLEPGGCSLASNLQLRTGPQFSYDIGAADDLEGRDAIRFLVTSRDPNGRFFLRSKSCDRDLRGCYGWLSGADWGTQVGTDIPIDSWSPVVTAWRGFIGLPPVWMTTFIYRYGWTTRVSVARATMAYLSPSQRLFFPIDILRDMPTCPDTRGYWGDYDDLVLVDFVDSYPRWMRTTTDSLISCQSRWDFTSAPVHVRALIF